MSNICLNIEFLPGTSIAQAAEEAIELVNRLGIAYVQFDFNGVKCSVGRNATVETTVEHYRDATKSKHKWIVCNA